MTVTLSRASPSAAFLVHPPPFAPPGGSSQMFTERSNEHEASTCPNSGCAHASRQTEPSCAFHDATHRPCSHTRTVRSEEQVAIRSP